MSSEVEGRVQLNEYLEKPLEVSTGGLSTQQSSSSTSMGSGGFTGEYTLGPNGTIVSKDSQGDTRVEIGKRADGTYGLAVYDDNEVLMYDNTKIKTQYVFSTQMESASANWLAVVGFMTYCTDDGAERNLAVRLDFTKPSNFTITKATLFYKFNDFVDFSSSYRTTNVGIYLNPTKTLITPTSGMKYYRYSGTTITSGINPNADEYTNSVILSSSQINAINNNMNYIVAQQNTSSSTAGGYCVLNLVLEGYLSTM